MTDKIKSNKIKSRTLWITIAVITLFIFAVIFDFLQRKYFLSELFKNLKVDSTNSWLLKDIIMEIPLSGLATGVISVASLFVGGNKARDSIYNLKHSDSSSTTEITNEVTNEVHQGENNENGF